jgi:hypothetical protein
MCAWCSRSGETGARLHAIYAATRRTGPLGTPLMFTYRVEVAGLGVSQVHVDVDGLAQYELLVLASPIDATRSEVWLGARVRLQRWVPRLRIWW